MKTYSINEEQRQEVLKYMWTRPYGEVVKLMNSLSVLTPHTGGNTDVRKK